MAPPPASSARPSNLSQRSSSTATKTKIPSLRRRSGGNSSNRHRSAQQSITLHGTFVILQSQRKSVPGKSVSVQIYSGTEVDPETGKGKLSERAHFKEGKSKKHNDGTQTITYKIRVHVDLNFGTPTAFVLKNQHKKAFYLHSASIEAPNNHILHFDCNSWIYPINNTKSDRLFFSNSTCYLPSETPRALVELRKEELEILRGNGRGERKEWERKYDYELYNDLGDPDYGSQHLRPVLGASNLFPYPRRLRTGRQPSSTRSSSESRPESIIWSIYVPPDERCSPKKLGELQSNSVQAIVHFLIPEAKSLFEHNTSHSFKSFQEIINMFSGNRNQKIEGKFKDKIKKILVVELHKAITHASHKSPVQYPLPQIISENEWAWMDDMEFGRQMLAGVHPVRIQRLKRFPPQSKNGVNSSIDFSDVEQSLDGLTLLQAMQEGRIFMLDHHDYLIPFLNRINTNGICAYASRTLLFLGSDGMLKPIAIELSLPGLALGKEKQRVFLPAKEAVDAALWQLAKAHVAANDSLYHQLISHWLHTHAIVEPFIIATRRQLSVMHPIHRMLNPHFRDTIHINALARCILINSEGIFEKTLFSGEISMEISSMLYKEWRFDEQGLPADLLKRGVAIEDPDVNNPTGIQLVLPDYPYATDGLEIWVSIKQWVKDFCSFFYKDDNAIKSDAELQAWWSEIQNVGHGDKRNEIWWNQMTTLTNLVEVLTVLIWTASALHASLNYGQYAYCGYPPNRPTLCRKFIPEEGTYEFAEFLKDPDKFLMQMLPGRFEMSLAVALADVLSRHTSSEVYLGGQSSEWIDNEEVQKRFARFSEELKQIQTRILSRNNDPKLKNRRGPAKMAYNLLCPNTSGSGSKESITGRGIPNNISI